MIGYLHGTITELFPDSCFIDVKGVGYHTLISSTTRSRLKKGQEAMVYTYLNVREDALQLYGFSSHVEHDIFLHLISVSGIGPKAALSILSVLSADKIVWAVQNKQISLLTTAPGIGKKTAERIILELKDKLSDTLTGGETFDETISPEETTSQPDIWTDAKQALASFGYTSQEIFGTLKKAGHLNSVEEIIKFALKDLSK